MENGSSNMVRVKELSIAHAFFYKKLNIVEVIKINIVESNRLFFKDESN